MSSMTLALIAVFLLALGALLSRYAPREESRAIAVGFAGLALVASISGTLVDGSTISDHTSFGGWLWLDSAGSSMLPALAAIGLGVVLAMPANEAGHRTLSQSLALPALVMASLLVNQLALLLALDVLVAVVCVRASVVRAARAQAVFRTLGTVFVVAGIAQLPTSVWFMPIADVSRTIGVQSATLMAIGLALQLGVGPASACHRAAICDGLSGRSLLTLLPLGGMAMMLRVVGPAFAHSASSQAIHLALLVLLASALMTAGIVLVQRYASHSLALLISTTNAISIAGMMEPDRGASLGGELLWAATLLAGAGLAVTLLALRARHGRLPVDRFAGFYRNSPQLGALLLFFAVALGGLPGTLNFAALDLILHGDVSHGLDTLVLAATTMAVAGFGAVRLAFHLLFGPPTTDGLPGDMPLLGRERRALLPMALLLLIAGLIPSVLPVVRRASSQSGETAEHSVQQPPFASK